MVTLTLFSFAFFLFFPFRNALFSQVSGFFFLSPSRGCNKPLSLVCTWGLAVQLQLS